MLCSLNVYWLDFGSTNAGRSVAGSKPVQGGSAFMSKGPMSAQRSTNCRINLLTQSTRKDCLFTRATRPAGERVIRGQVEEARGRSLVQDLTTTT